MKYKVVSKDWNYDFTDKKIEYYVILQSNSLKECKIYEKKNNIP